MEVFHRKTKNIYIFMGYGRMKIDGEWEDSAVYTANDTIYTRRLKDFEESFTILGSENIESELNNGRN